MYANAKPLHRPPASKASAPSASAALPPNAPGPSAPISTPAAPVPEPSDTAWADVEDEATASLSAQPPSALLRPRLNTSMYDEPPAATASLEASAGGLMNDMPVVGPSVGPAPPQDGMMVEGYAEAGHDEHGGYDLSEGRVVDISQEEMRKVINQPKQSRTPTVALALTPTVSLKPSLSLTLPSPYPRLSASPSSTTLRRRHRRRCHARIECICMQCTCAPCMCMLTTVRRCRRQGR